MTEAEIRNAYKSQQVTLEQRSTEIERLAALQETSAKSIKTLEKELATEKSKKSHSRFFSPLQPRRMFQRTDGKNAGEGGSSPKGGRKDQEDENTFNPHDA